jgi:porphobilinogen synthase
MDTLSLPHRLRRLRRSAWLRALVQEHRLHAEDLIWPVFVREGKGAHQPIADLPDVERYSIDVLVKEAKKAHALGIQALAVFPVVEASRKSADAREALNANNLVCRAIAALKKALPTMGVIADVALDPYTSHGHDGLFAHGDVANDTTVAMLCKQSVVLAQAGADIVAPSDMMDGRVGAIRDALDDAGFTQVAILAYTAKYASAFYGPFRSAVGSKNTLGKADKRTYQMQPANSKEAMLEAALDTAEGADMLMVKPGLPYLDIVARLSDQFELPVLAYHVSGEYAALKFAARAGAIDFNATLMESLLAFKRAGARAILTYGAREAAALLKQARY